jgi:hypothetical protein
MFLEQDTVIWCIVAAATTIIEPCFHEMLKMGTNRGNQCQREKETKTGCTYRNQCLVPAASKATSNRPSSNGTSHCKWLFTIFFQSRPAVPCGPQRRSAAGPRPGVFRCCCRSNGEKKKLQTGELRIFFDDDVSLEFKAYSM